MLQPDEGCPTRSPRWIPSPACPTRRLGRGPLPSPKPGIDLQSRFESEPHRVASGRLPPASAVRRSSSHRDPDLVPGTHRLSHAPKEHSSHHDPSRPRAPSARVFRSSPQDEQAVRDPVAIPFRVRISDDPRREQAAPEPLLALGPSSRSTGLGITAGHNIRYITVITRLYFQVLKFSAIAGNPRHCWPLPCI